MIDVTGRFIYFLPDVITEQNFSLLRYSYINHERTNENGIQ